MKISNAFITMRNFIQTGYSSRKNVRSASDSPACYIPSTTSAPWLDSTQDKTLLLKPLNDEHLIEVYREAKAMHLSEDFIQLIESALEQRNLPVNEL